MSKRYYSNTASQAALAAAIGATDVTINFTAGSFTGYPTQYPYTAAIARGTADEEIVLVTAASGDSATVQRAYDGTLGKAHGAGATFTEVVVALDYREANDHVNATSAVHGTVGAVVGDTDAQTLTNKTLTNPTVTDGTFTGVQTVAEAHVTTLTVTGVTTLAGFAASGNGSVAGTFTVAGVTTLTGALNANGGVTVPAGKATSVDTLTASGLATLNGGATVPAGKKITITDDAAADTDAANAHYVKGLFTTPPAGRKVPVFWGSLAAPPPGALDGDTYRHSGLGQVFVYDSTYTSPWRQVDIKAVADGPARGAVSTNYASVLYNGYRVYQVDKGIHYTWDTAEWIGEFGAQLPMNEANVGGATLPWGTAPHIRAGTTFALTDGNGNIGITFTNPFPNDISVAVASSGDIAGNLASCICVGYSKNGLSVTCRNTAGQVITFQNVRINWIAVGW